MYTLTENLIKSLTDTSLASTSTQDNLYQITRQAALIAFANIVISDQTIAQLLLDKENHHTATDYLHTYITRKTPETIVDIGIFDTRYIAQRFPINKASIQPGNQYPNLYIARERGLNHLIIIEIDKLETAILHELLSQPYSPLHLPIAYLTNDPQLSKTIQHINDNLTARLENRHYPYTTANMPSNHIGLLLPTRDSSNNYFKQLSFLAEHVPTSALPEPYQTFTSQMPVGKAARRLRQLAMTYEDKNLTIQDIASLHATKIIKATPWKDLTFVEKAVHQNRYLHSTFLNLLKTTYQVLIISRNRLKNTAGFDILIISADNTTLLQTTIDYKLINIEEFTEELGELPPVNTEPIDLNHAAYNYDQGFYTPPSLRILFQVYEKNQDDINEQNIEKKLLKFITQASTSNSQRYQKDKYL